MIQIKENIICDTIEGGIALLDPINENIAILKAEEKEILQMGQKMSLEELVKFETERYKENSTTIRKDIEQFFMKLEEKGFLEILED